MQAIITKYLPATNATVQDAISELLSALGFDAMARESKSEQDPARLSRYARVIIKQTRDENAKREISNRFRLLNLI